MEPESQSKTPHRQYAVFISYRHEDNRVQGRQWATWLHQILESYEVPPDLVGEKNSRGTLISASLYPVFRDEEELPADANLSRNIERALENSHLLVVLCSPRAVVSKFVAKEIQYFKELGKSDCILALMIDGEPNASDDPGKVRLGIKPEMECLPQPLRYGMAGDDGKIDWAQRTEPIAADLRPEGNPEQGWTTSGAYREALQNSGNFSSKVIAEKVSAYEKRLELAKLKVIAGALGVPLGELTRRDKAMQLAKARKRARALKLWLAAVGVLALLAVAGGIYASFQRKEAITQRQEAIAQKQVAENERKEALETASETDFAIATLKMGKQNWPETMAYLAESLRNDPQNQKAMVLAVSLIRSLPLPIAVIRPTNRVESATFSPDGKRVLTMSDDKWQIWDAQTGQPIPYQNQNESAVLSPDYKQVITSSNGVAQVCDGQTGQPIGRPMIPGGDISSAGFSPDGQLVLTESKIKMPEDTSPPQTVVPMGPGKDGPGADVEPDDQWEGYTLRLWDAKTGLPIGQPMKNNFGNLNSVNISPDSRWAVTVFENTAQVWDARTGQPVGQPMKHAGAVRSVSFSPDSQRILLVCGTATLWDTQTGLTVGLPMHVQGFSGFSPDSKWVLTVTYDTAHLWNARTGQPVGQPMKGDSVGNLDAASFSANSQWVVLKLINDSTQFWDTQTGQPAEKIIDYGENVFSLSFSPDSQWIVTASDQTAQILDAGSLHSVGLPMEHIGLVDSASFSPDGQHVITTSDDNTVRIWEAPTGKLVGIPLQHDNEVVSASFSPEGKQVLEQISVPGPPKIINTGVGSIAGYATGTEQTLVCDAQTGRLTGETVSNDVQQASVIHSPDGKLVLSISNGLAQVYDFQTGAPLGAMMTQIRSASFSPNSQWIMTVSNYTDVLLRDAHTTQPIGQPMRGNDASFSPDSRWLLAISAYGRIAQVYDIQTTQPLGSAIKLNGNISSAVFSPNGQYVVTASDDKIAQVWDAQTGLRIGKPMEHDYAVSYACFSPDSQWVATSEKQGRSVRLWDAQTGQPVSLPIPLTSLTRFSSFSPDGQKIVLLTDGGGARISDAIIKDDQAPPWLADLVEIVGGRHLNSHGVIEPSSLDPATLRQELQKLPGDDTFSRFGRWIASDPSTRTIDPLSTVTTPEFIAASLRDNTTESVQEAYDAAPCDPLVLASLAKFETNQDKALFLCRHALQRAQIEYPPEKIEQVRSLAKAVFPDLPEFNTP